MDTFAVENYDDSGPDYIGNYSGPCNKTITNQNIRNETVKIELKITNEPKLAVKKFENGTWLDMMSGSVKSGQLLRVELTAPNVVPPL